jgi:hypothetical protein
MCKKEFNKIEEKDNGKDKKIREHNHLTGEYTSSLFSPSLNLFSIILKSSLNLSFIFLQVKTQTLKMTIVGGLRIIDSNA